MPHAYNSTDLVNDFKFFETGYILIDEKRYDVEEISINSSRDMTPYHVAAQRDPIDQRPGKNKIEFSMKRAFSDATLSNLYDYAPSQTTLHLNSLLKDMDTFGQITKKKIVNEQSSTHLFLDSINLLYVPVQLSVQWCCLDESK